MIHYLVNSKCCITEMYYIFNNTFCSLFWLSVWKTCFLKDSLTYKHLNVTCYDVKRIYMTKDTRENSQSICLRQPALARGRSPKNSTAATWKRLELYRTVIWQLSNQRKTCRRLALVCQFGLSSSKMPLNQSLDTDARENDPKPWTPSPKQQILHSKP